MHRHLSQYHAFASVTYEADHAHPSHQHNMSSTSNAHNVTPTTVALHDIEENGMNYKLDDVTQRTVINSGMTRRYLSIDDTMALTPDNPAPLPPAASSTLDHSRYLPHSAFVAS
jgi:hypothetical protein